MSSLSWSAQIGYMIRFTATAVFVDTKETTLRFKINAESPEEAALTVFDREDDLKPRPMQVGDAVIVLNPESAFTGYYIYDSLDTTGKPTLKQVIEGELDLWRRIMASDPVRTEGVDIALKKAGVI